MNSMMRKLFGLSVVLIGTSTLACATSGATVNVASDPGPLEAVNTIVWGNAFNKLRKAGYNNPSSQAFLMQDTSYRDIPYQLVGGNDYYFLGGCDSKCTDLDLVLFNSKRQRVDYDILTNNFPVVHYTPLTDEIVTLRTIMVKCQAPSCWAAVVRSWKVPLSEVLSKRAVE